MRWQDAAKALSALGGVGIVALFAVLFNLSGMAYSYTGDALCDGLECPAYIEVNTSYWNFGFENTNAEQTIYLPADLKDFDGKLTRYKVSELDFIPILYKFLV